MNLVNFTKKLALDAGKIIRKHFQKSLNIQKKSRHDLVTNADKEVEKFLIGNIRKKFPDHEILSEEKGKSAPKKSTYRWIIDPIDGTTNFVHGMPFFAVSIALEYKRKPIIGVVYNPILNELFSAEKNHGAFLNNKKIHVSKTRSLDDSLLATGFHPHYRDHNMKFFQIFTADTRGVRRLGAATLDLCYTACGILDGFWEFGLYPWDVAAGKLIVEEAGGRVTNTDGSAFDYDKKAILATNGKLHAAIQKTLK